VRVLTKLDKPQVLRDNETRWTARYVAATGAGDPKPHEKWGHSEIKRVLRDEVKGKCAYCEGYVDDISYPHVEHIVPKTVKPELAHRWENLTSACGRCNIAKGDFYDAADGLLNPYEDPLDAHLVFLGSLISWDLGSVRGELTVRRLRLNRLDLANARANRLDEIREVLERWHDASDPLRGVLADGLRLDAREGEFSRSVLAYLSFFEFPV
jgi:5-methylcytosine-specific restriction endonuclease McrA